jgi:hypothetical protein
MSRSNFMSYRPAVLAAAIAAAGLAVAGCGPHSTASSAGTSSSSPASAGKATASASAASGTSNSGLASAYTIFPAAVGNTWVYDETLATGSGTGTGTNRITAVTPVAGGEQVTMTVQSQLPELPASKPATVDLIFHSDGSISYPLAQLGSTAVTIKSGSIIWPSSAQLASGQPYTDKLVMSITENGQPTTVTANVVVKGAGSATVTVPAGTYQTTLIDETLSEQFDGIAVDMQIQNWDASGVGPVKTAVTSTADGKSTIVSTEELKSFTKG